MDLRISDIKWVLTFFGVRDSFEIECKLQFSPEKNVHSNLEMYVNFLPLQPNFFMVRDGWSPSWELLKTFR